MLTVVKRAFLFSGLAAAACVASPALAAPPAQQPLPPLPGQYAPPPPNAQPAQTGAATMPSPQQLYEHIRKGVVAITRNGLPVAIGTVLGNDGRILTALSGLGGGDTADVRYADGTTVHAKIGHSDRDLDLALLVPQSGKWTDGLAASESDPQGADLRALIPSGRGGQVGPAQASVKGREDAHAKDGEALPQMLDVDLKGLPVAGAPLLDVTGNVVGVLVRACKGAAPAPQPQAAEPSGSPWAAWGAAAQPAQQAAKAAVQCTPVVLGAPVNAIRGFLQKTPAAAVAPAPWLGIRGETENEGATHGVRVLAVAPQSPAEKAGLKPNSDVIVAVDQQSIDSPEKLAELIGKHAPGDTVKLLVSADGRFREVAVALKPAP
jgi:serine protease Do